MTSRQLIARLQTDIEENGDRTIDIRIHSRGHGKYITFWARPQGGTLVDLFAEGAGDLEIDAKDALR